MKEAKYLANAPYSPRLRESLAWARRMNDGYNPSHADLAIAIRR